MKEIKLTRGHVALVDDEDFEELSKYKWHATKEKKTTKNFYAVRTVKVDNKIVTIHMHRVVMNLQDKSKFVDHINHIGCDNRKINLRICTHSENVYNSRKKYDKIGYKGVYKCQKSKTWSVQIQTGNKRISKGGFLNPEDAARHYNQLNKQLRGEFAYQNII